MNNSNSKLWFDPFSVTIIDTPNLGLIPGRTVTGDLNLRVVVSSAPLCGVCQNNVLSDEFDQHLVVAGGVGDTTLSTPILPPPVK